jgi:hypothetical protein
MDMYHMLATPQGVEKSWRLYGGNVEKRCRVEKTWRLPPRGMEENRHRWRKYGDYCDYVNQIRIV